MIHFFLTKPSQKTAFFPLLITEVTVDIDTAITTKTKINYYYYDDDDIITLKLFRKFLLSHYFSSYIFF